MVYRTNIVLGFKIIKQVNPNKKPPFLSKFMEIKSFQTFHSTSNTDIYVIHNHIDDEYDVYERLESNLNNKKVDEYFHRDLENLIEIYYKPKLSEPKPQ